MKITEVKNLEGLKNLIPYNTSPNPHPDTESWLNLQMEQLIEERKYYENVELVFFDGTSAGNNINTERKNS